jgi:uncharacterized membrane protein YbaN (DUF454 family)
MAEQPSDLPETYQPKLVTGFWKWMYVALGMFFLGLAYLGWVLPGLPWSPFVILASYCFGRSSPKLDAWLMNNRYFGSHLRDVRLRRGIRRRLKKHATIMVILVVSLSVGTLIVTGQPWYVWAVIPPLALVGLCMMWLGFRTLPDEVGQSSGNV